MILLLAVCPPDIDPPEGVAAYDGRSVRVLYQERAHPPARSVQELVETGRLVQQLARRGPVLPVRFGTAVDSMAELYDVVQAEQTGWSQALTRLAGHLELVVHLPERTSRAASEGNHAAGAETSRSPADEGVSGREYLLRRAAKVQEHAAAVERVVREVVDRVGPVADARLLPALQGERVAVLVPVEDLARTRGALERWGSEEPGVRVSGPWPPFSFCGEVG